MAKMESKHIHSAFDEDLKEIYELIFMMGGMVEEAIGQASLALQNLDGDIAESVVVKDKMIDDLEEEIHKATVRILALRQPQAQDLRIVVAVIRIAIILERVGDYAKNIAKRTMVLTESPPLAGQSVSIKNLAKSVRGRTKTALDSLVLRDADMAAEVIRLDEDIDRIYNSLFREFLTHMMEDPRSITATMHLLFMAKNLERIGDHATGIAEQVIYVVTGARPDQDRPKKNDAKFLDGPTAFPAGNSLSERKN